VFFIDAAQDAHLLFQHRAFLFDRAPAFGRKIDRDPAGDDAVHQIAMAEQRGIVAQHLLLQYPELGEAERQSHIVAEITQVAEVVGDALALQQQRAKPQRAIRRRDVGDALCRHRIGPGIGHGAVAADPPGEFRPLLQAQALEAFLDALWA